MKTLRTEQIEPKIHLFRGHRVMLDRDLAALYGVKTKALNQAAKRHRRRFPSDFMFQLGADELRGLRSQIVTLKRGKHYKYRPFAFTEQGVAMLSSVLNSARAIAVNIAIMRAFIKVREVSLLRKELAARLTDLENKIVSHDEHIQEIFKALRQLTEEPPDPRTQYI